MKKYVKPALMALELEADAALCAGCSHNVHTDVFLAFLLDYPDLSLLFIKEENCNVDTNLDFEKYCKFTGADENTVFAS